MQKRDDLPDLFVANADFIGCVTKLNANPMIPAPGPNVIREGTDGNPCISPSFWLPHAGADCPEPSPPYDSEERGANNGNGSGSIAPPGRLLTSTAATIGSAPLSDTTALLASTTPNVGGNGAKSYMGASATSDTIFIPSGTASSGTGSTGESEQGTRGNLDEEIPEKARSPFPSAGLDPSSSLEAYTSQRIRI
ncbi:uncharacterized protein BCR38DRAFT_404211 [Pseudomassariella vexata]|uniref:Uncharacterized protein n=1 Tax=Pseudomassariella vexata TaxID=1141098 RepID=A0A1Y2EHQ3_9PEZI|nr:uncharacterized protein BCR38DRAFT_404211 [Pseudomassariella vexata]ORY71083.1 hypothetical protein BCR38DRAFT_404211 [Pseudomassariella vexata]